MTYEIVTKPSFSVAGIEARTNNLKEMTGFGSIRKLWDRFLKEGLHEKIQGKVEPDKVLAFYMEYESDMSGDYTYFIGTKVDADQAQPEGVITKNIPESTYSVIPTEEGKLEKVVVRTWMSIWAKSDKEIGGKRAYSADFEIYDAKASSSEEGQVDIYLSINPNK